MKPISWIAVLTVLVTCDAAPAADWPQWRGPDRDGKSQEKGLLKQWPEAGPKLLWTIKDAGGGYSTPAVVGDRLYLMGNRGLDEEFVQARSVADGKLLWSVTVGKVGNPKQQPPYPGSRSTPTVDGDVLYALGSDGDLVCLATADGKQRWKKNLRTDFGGKPGTWAYSESPLVDGERLVVTPGGPDATIVALDKKSGDAVWKSAVPGGDAAGYASVIVVDAGGKSSTCSSWGTGSSASTQAMASFSGATKLRPRAAPPTSPPPWPTTATSTAPPPAAAPVW